jgi:flavodoxin
MKTLVAYYSRTGVTRKVALAIAKALRCDLDEIIDKKDRSGILGFVIGGYHAVRKKLTEISVKKNPQSYDFVIIGSPVWGSHTCPAVRTYLTNNKLKKVAFFCTMGGSVAAKTFADMAMISQKPVATLALRQRDVLQGNVEVLVKDFVNKLKK